MTSPYLEQPLRSEAEVRATIEQPAAARLEAVLARWPALPWTVAREIARWTL